MAEITRAERERREGHGAAGVRAGTPDYGLTDDTHTDVVDALTNIMHYCEARGIVFDVALNTARGHLHAERDDAHLRPPNTDDMLSYAERASLLPGETTPDPRRVQELEDDPD